VEVIGLNGTSVQIKGSLFFLFFFGEIQGSLLYNCDGNNSVYIAIQEKE